MTLTKRALRQSVRQTRRSLSRVQQQQAAQRLCMRLLRSRWFKASQKIGFYWPSDGEISTLPLLKWAARLNKQCFLPVIQYSPLVHAAPTIAQSPSDQNGFGQSALTLLRQQLMFRRYYPGDRLSRNRYQIPEPALHRTTLHLDQLDLVLVPLVAFDSNANRLGMGAGFYDRAFARASGAPWRIGVAHDLQKVAQLPVDVWDVPLHGVMTDRAFYSA